MKRKDICHFSTSGDTEASVIERFNRTLKKTHVSLLHRQEHIQFFTRRADLVTRYNRSYHRSIKMAPRRASVEELVR